MESQILKLALFLPFMLANGQITMPSCPNSVRLPIGNAKNPLIPLCNEIGQGQLNVGQCNCRPPAVSSGNALEDCRNKIGQFNERTVCPTVLSCPESGATTKRPEVAVTTKRPEVVATTAPSAVIESPFDVQFVTPPQPANRATCSDSRWECKQWADYGECQRNSGYMLLKCQNSCNCCGCTFGDIYNAQFGDRCLDRNENCRIWAENGHCGINPEYMEIYCRYSCKICGAFS